jgi:enoyl-CoA hydratase
MLTARIFDAEEAHRIGLVVDLHDDAGLEAAAVAKAAQVAAMPALGTELTKEAAWAGVESSSLERSIDLENRQQTLLGTSPDHLEALQAFAERREPRFNQPVGRQIL